MVLDEIFSNPMNLIITAFIIGGLLFIFISKVRITGHYNIYVSENNAKSIYYVGIILIALGLLVYIFPFVTFREQESATITSVESVHNISFIDLYGMRVNGMEILVTVTSKNMKDQNYYVKSFFYYTSGGIIQGAKQKYRSNDGTVVSKSKMYKPIKNNDTCILPIYIPYNEFPANNTYFVKYNVYLGDENGFFAKSGPYTVLINRTYKPHSTVNTS
jgi:hypothetical protein